MTVTELAAILGENLYSQRLRGLEYATEPGPKIVSNEYNEDGSDITVPGTLVMSIDGQIDLMELAKSVIAALPTVPDPGQPPR